MRLVMAESKFIMSCITPFYRRIKRYMLISKHRSVIIDYQASGICVSVLKIGNEEFTILPFVLKRHKAIQDEPVPLTSGAQPIVGSIKGSRVV